MYDKELRDRVLLLVDMGNSPAHVSRLLGGKPSRATIMKWVNGQIPTGKRRERCMLTREQKVRAVQRVLAGERADDVAAEVGCASATLLTWRRKFEQGGENALATKIDDWLEGFEAKNRT